MAAFGVTKLSESRQPGLDDHEGLVLRKRRRMISNRESARRSRIRKKKHMDDLLGQVNQLVSENKYMAINLKDTTQMLLNMDSENSVLRAQLDELTHQFELLGDIINGLSSPNNDHGNEASMTCGVEDEFLLQCDNMLHDNQKILVDMFLN